MIARLWHGWTTKSNADAYQQHLLAEVLPGIAAQAKTEFRGAHVLRREKEAETEFVTILFFESLDAIRCFAGDDHEAAYITPSARQLLSRFDRRVEHYQTVFAAPAPQPK